MSNYRRAYSEETAWALPTLLIWLMGKKTVTVSKGLTCSDYRATLNDLIYERSQGFSLFGLEVMNSDAGELDKQYKNEFEKILGTPLRVIYKRI